MSVFSSNRRICASLLFAMGVAAAAVFAVPAIGGTAAVVPERQDTSDAYSLASILEEQEALLNALKNDPNLKRLPDAEKGRRVSDLRRRYELLLSRRSDDAAVMVLYGKFLRLVGEREAANHWFTRADVLMPNTGVIKHQLGAYAAEEGRYLSALNLLEQAVTLEPNTAVYHYHLGEVLATYRDHFVKDKLLETRAACDARAQAAFLRASELKPSEPVFLLRYAESFFDCEKPDWKRALPVWAKISTAAKTPVEREAAQLQCARALIGMKRFAEAREIIAAVKTPALAALRDELTAMLGDTLPKVNPAVSPAPAPASAPAPAKNKTP